jgi:hypothetical protein
LSAEVARHVFAEDTIRPALVHDPEQLIDKPPVVVRSLTLSRDAVGLAGVSRSEAMNEATPWSSVEGSSVRPDRSRMKPPCFHARDQACGGCGFPLHVQDAARAGFSDGDAEFEAADPGAETEDIEGTYSHVIQINGSMPLALRVALSVASS